MQPSKAIFSKNIELDAKPLDELKMRCFDEAYSPKHTLEELIAEFEATLQSKLNQDPGAYLSKDLPGALKPARITLKINQPDETHLAGVIKHKGKNLSFVALMEFEPVLLLGVTGNGYLIINEKDRWNEFVDVVFIRNETGVELQKIRLVR